MRALVTGGCGFIGSNLVKKLISENWDVEVVDDLSSGDISSLGNIPMRVVTTSLLANYESFSIEENDKTLVITGDFASPYILSRVANKRYDLVFHLAAMPRVEFSVKNPILTTDNNVSKTVALMAACCGNVKKFIFSSSSAIYGDVEDNFPSKESGPCQPSSPYALQKKVVEEYCSLFYKLYDLESVCFRYFNVYGPGQLGDSPYSTAVSAWMDKLSKEESLRSDGDGEQSRDLIYIDDVVRANLIAATSTRVMKGDVYNIGTGKRYTNNRILEMIYDRVSDITIHQAPARDGDVRHTQADMEKTFNELSFKAEWDFESGLNETISWWGLNENKS